MKLSRPGRRREDPFAGYDPVPFLTQVSPLPREVAHEPAAGTVPDMSGDLAPLARPYVPGPLDDPGRLSPAAATTEADLAGCVLFRRTVHSVCVRAEPHHGCGTTWPAQLGTWPERWAAIYWHRTTIPGAVGDLSGFGLAAAFDQLDADIDKAFLAERLAAASGLTWAGHHADSGFRAASRVFHSEDEVMTGGVAA